MGTEIPSVRQIDLKRLEPEFKKTGFPELVFEKPLPFKIFTVAENASFPKTHLIRSGSGIIHSISCFLFQKATADSQSILTVHDGTSTSGDIIWRGPNILNGQEGFLSMNQVLDIRFENGIFLNLNGDSGAAADTQWVVNITYL